MFRYPDGQVMRPGDCVVDPAGQRGWVKELFEDPERAVRNQLRGRGVVVEMDGRGLVFLSSELLASEPLQLVGRGAPPEWANWAKGARAFCLLLLPIALGSLVSATWSAWTSGEVLVLAGDEWVPVPWRRGWTRFVGPLLMLAAWVLWAEARHRDARWWLALGVGIAGMGLIVFSGALVTRDGSLRLAFMLSLVAITLAVDTRFGRKLATAVLLGLVGWTVWLSVGS